MNSDIAYMEWQNIPFRVVDIHETYSEIRLLPDQNTFSIRFALGMNNYSREHILMKVFHDELPDFYFRISYIVPGISCYRL